MSNNGVHDDGIEKLAEVGGASKYHAWPVSQKLIKLIKLKKSPSLSKENHDRDII